MRRHLALTLLLLLTLLVIPGGGSRAGAASLNEDPVEPFILYEDWVTYGVQQSAEYGYALASAGDVDGDGYTDVLVGAPAFKLTIDREGAAFLFRGNQQGLEDSPSWSAGSAMKGARFGHSVAGAGDLNCDGYDDIAIGAPRYNDGQPEEGAVFVFYGSPDGPSPTPDWSVQSDQKGAWYGVSVAGAGNVNNDKNVDNGKECDDLLVGAHLYTNGQTSEGAAFLYLGSPQGLSTSPQWHAEGEQVEAHFGYAVSSAGDLNADDFADVLVGARMFQGGEVEEGAVFVYHGSASGLPLTLTRLLEGNQVYSRFGASVAAAGDLNGDGFSDIAIGAPLYDDEDGAADEGAVFVYYGSTGGLSSLNRGFVYSGQANSNFGVSVASAGDMNADGFSDLLVGAPRYTADQPEEGAAFIFQGSADGMLAPHTWQMEGNKNDTNFGFSVAYAGDVNDDEFSDVIAGAPLYKRDDKTIMGSVFLYHGLVGADVPPEPPVYPTYLPMISAAQ
jgi:hypothetical protein